MLNGMGLVERRGLGDRVYTVHLRTFLVKREEKM